MDHLSRATLGRVPQPWRPRVVPGTIRAGIVHLGVGAFHRAHQAVYTDAAMAADGSDEWGIVGVAPRRPELIDVLRAQDGLFSVTTLSDGDTNRQVVGSICDVRHAPSDPSAVVNRLAESAIRVVTMTVTEKAYLLDPATGKLAASDSLHAELAGAKPPASVPALLVAGLRARAQAEAGPIALVSCDNLPSNGDLLRGCVTAALALIGDDALSEWIAENVAFPRTMVDRIVPATTPELLSDVARALGVSDDAAVAAEPFSQWVIEDRFPGGRPAWEAAGAVLTDDATPYERLKLRTLNGVHSTLAYLGALAGCRTIAEATSLPGMRDLLEQLIAEDVAPSFTPPDGVDVLLYGQSVLSRFSNPAIEHRTTQVAMDGSQKLPQRILHTISDRRANGAVPRWATLTVAAWMRFVHGQSDDGQPLTLDDPLAAEIRDAIRSKGTDQTINALLQLDTIFPADLAADEDVRKQVATWYEALSRHGARDVVSAAVPLSGLTTT